MQELGRSERVVPRQQSQRTGHSKGAPLNPACAHAPVGLLGRHLHLNIAGRGQAERPHTTVHFDPFYLDKGAGPG